MTSPPGEISYRKFLKRLKDFNVKEDKTGVKGVKDTL